MVRPAAAPWRSVPYPPPDGEREGSTDPSRFVGAAAPPLLMFPVLGLIQLYPSTPPRATGLLSTVYSPLLPHPTPHGGDRHCQCQGRSPPGHVVWLTFRLLAKGVQEAAHRWRLCEQTWHRRARVMKQVQIYTDGACAGNPGPGGWAALLVYIDGQQQRREKTVTGYE